MSIKDLIAAAYNKDATAFESAFQSVMQDKVSAAVENAFTAEEFEEDLDEAKKSEKDDEEDDDEEDDDEDEEDMKEEVEELGELSDDKLKAYHAKAGADRQKAKATVTKNMNAKNPTAGGIDKATDAYKRFQKRGAGMTAAANKMSEETEELGELSKNTVRSYYNKAGEQGKKIMGNMMVGGGDWSKDGKDTNTLKKRAAGRAMALKRRSGEVKMSEETEE